MKRLTTALILYVALALAGCAYQPVEKDYTGPVAYLQDSGYPEDSTKAAIFAAVEIDGKTILHSFSQSASASYGRGFFLTTVYTGRKVKAEPMKVTLNASHATGAPIAAIASKIAGTFFSVEGVVDFTPSTDGRYVVKGVLKKEGSKVWIEDLETGKPVTAIISK